MARYTVVIRKHSDHSERAFRVRASSEDAARTQAARLMFGPKAFFRGDLPGVRHVGQLWWRHPMGHFGAIESASALTGRVSARVVEGW